VPESYEEVRRKLVDRGYLRGPVARFVLADLLAGEAPRALVMTSLKAALLGAPLLGGLLAASAVASNRPTLSARDAAVLTLYFGAIAAIVLFAVDVAAALVSAAWARRRGARPSDALRAGLIVAVPLLAYLVVLWARGGAGSGLGADLVFLTGATATAALVAWLTGLVSLAGIVGRTGEVPDRRRRSALIGLAVLAPVALGVFVLPAISAGSDGAVPPSPFARLPLAERLVVVGVDGLDGGLVESQSAAGTADHLLALLAEGAVYPTHRETAEPPEVWTTIATGMTADEHGVRQAGAARLPGITAPIAPRAGPLALGAALRFLLPATTVPTSSVGRRVRTLWEMTGLASSTAAVGWWSSWPARGTEGDPAGGYVVSDRVLAKLLGSGAEDRDTQPASLFTRLRQRFPAERQSWRAAFDERFVSLPETMRGVAWESYLIDAFAWQTTVDLMDDPSVGASFVYLPGLDILRTRLAGREGAGDATASYLAWLDQSIFASLSKGSGTRTVIIADPGRSAGEGAEGFVAVVAPGVEARCVGPAVGDGDIAPIVLRVAGLPASREMKGSAPQRCFERADPAPSAIATWGRRGRPAASARSDYDPEMVERLKSLGYLR
jgi:hypothetical protein